MYYYLENLIILCAFKFESYMSQIKRKMKNSRYPLQQIYNRVVEDRKLTSVNKFNLREKDDNPLIMKMKKFINIIKKCLLKILQYH